MRERRLFSVAIVRCAAILWLAGAVAPARAVVINPTFTNNNGGTWTPTMQGVVNQAISEWQNIIQDNQTINVTFDFIHNGTNGYLAQWNGNYLVDTGTNLQPWSDGVTHVVHYNLDLMDTSRTNYLNFTAGSPDPNRWDALYVSRHELGHMFGIISGFYESSAGDATSDKWNAHVVGSTFDPGGLNVALDGTGDLSHTAASGTTAQDLMNPFVPLGVRRSASVLDLQMLQLADGYTVNPTALPEPTTLALFGVGGLVLLRRRRHAA